jgi:hypothetical protein
VPSDRAVCPLLHSDECQYPIDDARGGFRARQAAGRLAHPLPPFRVGSNRQDPFRQENGRQIPLLDQLRGSCTRQHLRVLPLVIVGRRR